MMVGSLANWMPGSSSFLPSLVLRSNTQTKSMSVAHSRSPLIQRPFGLLSTWPLAGRKPSSRILPSAETLVILPLPSLSAGLRSGPKSLV